MQMKIILTLLPLLQLVSTSIVGSLLERGSRSVVKGDDDVPLMTTSVTKLGNTSGKRRDIRSVTFIHKPDNISTGEHLIRGHFESDDFIRKEKIKRDLAPGSEQPWIGGDLDDKQFLKMHAFIVKDEDVPDCGITADKVTKTRYFICSGIILNDNQVLTSASCMNRADIYAYSIDADLAVLIGALDEDSYVIKIKSYDIHPHYVPDPNSIEHPINNIAVITLACSIPRKSMIIPELPSNEFDDIGHMCCGSKCQLSTVIQDSNNYHLVQAIETKYLPSPLHAHAHSHDSTGKIFRKRAAETNTDTDENVTQQDNVNDETKTDQSEKKTDTKQDDADKTNDPNQTVTNQQSDSSNVDETEKDQSKGNGENDQANGDNISKTDQPKNENNPNKNINKEDTTVDALKTGDKLEDESIPNKSSIKQVNVDNTDKTDDSNKNNLNKPTANQQNDNSNVDETQNKQPENRSENDSAGQQTKTDVVRKNVFCPPLGSPLVVNNILVGLIAYTCDDEQNWVEWKYVNIIHNVKWILTQIKKDYE